MIRRSAGKAMHSAAVDSQFPVAATVRTGLSIEEALDSISIQLKQC